MRVTIRTFAVIALAGLGGCRGKVSDKPPVHLIANMDTQEKGKSYRKDTSGLFADGRSMRTPPEGTVARGQLHEDDHASLGVLADGGMAIEFPAQYKPTDASRAHGAIRYQIYCSPCHGRDYDGKGTVADNKGLLVPPPSFKDDRLKEMTNGKMYAAMLLGVNNGNMPSYAAQIPEADRWAIISAIRQAQGVGDAVNGPAPLVASDKPTPEYGASLFKVKGCNACHSIDGSKLVGPSFKGLYGKTEATDKGDVTVDDAYLKESVLAPMAKIVTGYPPAMPPQALNDLEIKSISLFIQSLK